VGAIVLLLLGLGGCTATHETQDPRDGVFIHIQSGPDRPHNVLMGLRMAQIMAADRDVLVYFDIEGVHNVLKGAPDLKIDAIGSSHAILQDLVAHKVTLYACPGCLKALGKQPDQLMPGIALADKEGFFKFTRGRILTLDY
jgi:predicted peroxiredoxin